MTSILTSIGRSLDCLLLIGCDPAVPLSCVLTVFFLDVRTVPKNLGLLEMGCFGHWYGKLQQKNMQTKVKNVY